jgi:thermitase
MHRNPLWPIRSLGGQVLLSGGCTLAALLLLAMSPVPARANAQGTGRSTRPPIDWNAPHRPDSLIVRFRPSARQSSRAALHAAVGARVLRSMDLIPAHLVQFPSGTDIKEAVATYENDPDVLYAEPNYLYRAELMPDDASFAAQWGLHNTGQNGGNVDADIDAPEAWELQTGSSNVVVAVIDTGVDYRHSDLAPNLWTNEAELNGVAGVDDDGNGIVDDIYGARWTDGNGEPTSGDPIDGYGHGTHVSGIIGAVGNNGIGVAGVNHRVRLMSLKFLDDEGYGSAADAIAAIEYAVAEGAYLTSNSWGGGPFSQALRDAIAAAESAGQLFVAAAGNGGSDQIGDDNDIFPQYPSSYDLASIISVAASTEQDDLAYFSNYGRQSVDLAAPGTDILSTLPGNTYGFESGTSMATPYVSGVAALLFAHAPGASAQEVKQWILEGVDPIPALSGSSVTGGRLNAAASLVLAFGPQGRVSFDRDGYPCNTSLRITLRDRDLIGATAAEVVVTSSGGDVETVTLAQEPAGSGTFAVVLPSDSDTLDLQDGVLQVEDGVTLTVSYRDADNGTGAPATGQDTSVVDCVAPSSSQVAATRVSGAIATITCETNETTTVGVRYGTSCGDLSAVQAAPVAATRHEVSLAGLSPLTEYFFVIDLTDSAGNVRTEDNEGRCYSFTTTEQPDYFTELFSERANDLSGQVLVFAPNGSRDFYAACHREAEGWSTDPSGGTPLDLSDDGYSLVSLDGSARVHLYGQSYDSFFVGSNGYVTFGRGDTEYSESLEDHFALPRVAALFDDLNPPAGGVVSWKQLADRVAITFENVLEYRTSDVNSFQIELFFDGEIRITYPHLTASDGLAGLSGGTGVPLDFVASDLSGASSCAVPNSGTISGRIRSYQGDGAPGLAVELSGPETQQTTTDSTGHYEFLDLENSPQVIEPRKRNGVAGAVTSLDAVYVLQHLVERRRLDSLQQVACDVSGNGTISALDAAKILSLVVGKIDHFPAAEVCDSDWVFVPDAAPVSNQQLIPPLLEIDPATGARRCRRGAITLEPLTGRADEQNFIGVPFGDCTGNWRPSDGAGAALDHRAQEETERTARFGRPRTAGGNKVRVPVHVWPARYNGLDLQFTYDATHFRLTAIRKARALEQVGGMLQYKEVAPGLVGVAVASADPVRGSRALVLEFERLGDASSSPSIEPVSANVDEAQVRTSVARHPQDHP